MDSKKLKRNIIRLLCVVIASFISALNMKTFVNAGGLVPAGFNGTTVLIQRLLDLFFNLKVPFTPINLAINAIPACIAYKIVGKNFTIFSCVMIFLTSIFVDFIPVIPVTEDILLIAVFGGIINGCANSIALRGGASSGGTDFIAMSVSQKLHISTWNYVMGYNAIIVLISGYIFGWDKALYSIIFQFCSTQIVSRLHKKYQQMTLFVITEMPSEVMAVIMGLVHHGVTRFEGEGGYSGDPRTMLYSVVNTDEVKILRKAIKEIDPKAFINVTKTERLDGRFYQAPMD